MQGAASGQPSTFCVLDLPEENSVAAATASVPWAAQGGIYRKLRSRFQTGLGCNRALRSSDGPPERYGWNINYTLL